MTLSRRPALLAAAAAPLLLLAATGCAPLGPGGAAAPGTPTTRFAATLEASHPAVDAAVSRMDGFERRALREERAVAYAVGGGRLEADPTSPRAAAVTAVGAAEAAGTVLSPAFSALATYADRLAMAAGPEPERETEDHPPPEALAEAVRDGLRKVRATVPQPVQDAAIAGIVALASVPKPATGGAATVRALAEAAEPHLAAVAALLKAVIGPEPGTGTRGAIRARREAMDRGHARLLDAARRDPQMGAAGRYTLFHALSAMRDDDPAPGTLTSIVVLLDAMTAAHAALLHQDATVAEEKVRGFEAALARLSALGGAPEAASAAPPPGAQP